MRKLLILFGSVTIAFASWAQQPRPNNTTTPQKKPVSPFGEYAGEWIATFDGKVWLRLSLKLEGDKLTGALVHARDITLNDNGELKTVSGEQATETITEAVVNPDGLLITLKDADAKETDRYMMKLVQPAKDAADLKMVGQQMPPGMPKPKPWRVVRTGASPTSR
jgi:bacillopeptidase F (M6 metalloprotease family)